MCVNLVVVVGEGWPDMDGNQAIDSADVPGFVNVLTGVDNSKWLGLVDRNSGNILKRHAQLFFWDHRSAVTITAGAPGRNRPDERIPTRRLPQGGRTLGPGGFERARNSDGATSSHGNQNRRLRAFLNPEPAQLVRNFKAGTGMTGHDLASRMIKINRRKSVLFQERRAGR